jgi:arginase
VAVIVSPYFMGGPLPDLETPAPRRVLRPDLPEGTQQERMAVLYRSLADIVAADLDPRPVVIAGDCVSSIGVLAGLQRRGVDPTLLWFDAHGDFHTWATTQSRFIGGMPLAMIVGRGERTILEAAGCRPLAEERVMLVGARDLDPGEDEAVAESGMTACRVTDLLSLDLPDGDLYVHVDLDVVDPTDMPAQNYPAPGGPSLDEVLRALRRLADTARVAGASFSTWNPALPGADRAAAAGGRLVSVFLEPGSGARA